MLTLPDHIPDSLPVIRESMHCSALCCLFSCDSSLPVLYVFLRPFSGSLAPLRLHLFLTLLLSVGIFNPPSFPLEQESKQTRQIFKISFSQRTYLTLDLPTFTSSSLTRLLIQCFSTILSVSLPSSPC